MPKYQTIINESKKTKLFYTTPNNFKKFQETGDEKKYLTKTPPKVKPYWVLSEGEETIIY